MNWGSRYTDFRRLLRSESRHSAITFLAVMLLIVFAWGISMLSAGRTAAFAAGRSETYASKLAYAMGAVPQAGREATLDIVVRNITGKEADDWISAVLVDFTRTGIVPLDPGPVPKDWQARIEDGAVISYVAGHGVSAVHKGEALRLSPRVRNPSDSKDLANPRLIVIPLSSMSGFEGRALDAIKWTPFVEIRPTGRLRIKGAKR